MSGISRQASGLLSFFGIKNTGRSPDSLGATLAPVLDLRDWYFQQNSESISINQNVAAVGLNTVQIVPETETWAVLGCAVNSVAVLGAGVTLRIGGAWARNPNALTIYPLTLFGDPSTTGAVAVSWSPPGQVSFVPPGAVLGFYCSQLVAGPVNCTLNLTVVRMLL